METLQPAYEFELVFTDNCSKDRSFELIRELAERDERVRGLRFSRNFGFQRSILTAYLNARGDVAVQIDADLQDPPSLIPVFIEHWEAGSHVVYGVRVSRKEAWWREFLRKSFYRIINWLSEDELPLDSGDFRLIDRCVLDELHTMDDAQPYLRGTIATMGFRQVGVPYNRFERKRGTSHFSWSDLVTLAVDGILNHSIVPLRIATFVGLFVSLLTFIGSIAFLVGKLVFGQNWPAGFATTIVVVLLSSSLNAMFLGIIGEYLGRIYRQVKRPPLTIVEQRVGNFDEFNGPHRGAGSRIR